MKSKNLDTLSGIKKEREEFIDQIKKAMRSEQKTEDMLRHYEMHPAASFFEELKRASIDKKTYFIMLSVSVVLLGLGICVRTLSPFGDLSSLFSAIIWAIFLLISAIFLYINIKGTILRYEQIRILKNDKMLKGIEIAHYEGNLRIADRECGFDHEATMRDIRLDVGNMNP